MFFLDLLSDLLRKKNYALQLIYEDPRGKGV